MSRNHLTAPFCCPFHPIKHAHKLAPTADIDKEKLDLLCEEKGFVGWFDTSAKLNINIDKAARFLVERILDHQDIFQKKKATQVRAHATTCLYLCPALNLNTFVPVPGRVPTLRRGQGRQEFRLLLEIVVAHLLQYIPRPQRRLDAHTVALFLYRRI